AAPPLALRRSTAAAFSSPLPARAPTAAPGRWGAVWMRPATVSVFRSITWRSSPWLLATYRWTAPRAFWRWAEGAGAGANRASAGGAGAASRLAGLGEELRDRCCVRRPGTGCASATGHARGGRPGVCRQAVRDGATWGDFPNPVFGAVGTTPY